MFYNYKETVKKHYKYRFVFSQLKLSMINFGTLIMKFTVILQHFTIKNIIKYNLELKDILSGGIRA